MEPESYSVPVSTMSHWEHSCGSFLHRHTYRFGTLVAPHSKHRGFSRDVINPQNGHILCERNPVTCGFRLRIHFSSRIVNSTINRDRKILVAFIRANLLGEF